MDDLVRSPASVSFSLRSHGITVEDVRRNLAPAKLYAEAIRHDPNCAIADSGALIAYSGAKTGRSPKDKRVVKNPASEKDVWWGSVNIPLDPINGREQIQATIAMFLGMADKVWFDTLHIVADGPLVMTERIDHLVMGDKDIGLPVMGTFEVRDGKIAAWRDYFDMNQFTTMMQGE